MADERIDIDVRQALQDIAKLGVGLDGLVTKVNKAGNSFGEAFDQGFATGVADALNDLQREYDQLKKSADTLKTALKSATNPDAIKLYTQNIGTLEAGMKKLETTGKAAGVNLKEVNKSAGTGQQVFENFFGAFTKATIIIAAIEAVVKFTKYAVDLSEQIGTAKKSFEGFTGSAKEADKIVNTLIATGQKNFIPTDDILKAGKGLLAFGESADNLDAVLTRIADVSAATGKNFNELVTIYGKARTSGVLYAEDINQLVDAGIPIIQEFAKQMGVSESEIKKLASEGKISFEELQLAMFNLTAEGGKFADQAQNNANTISGAWNKLLADIQPATEKIGGFFKDLALGFVFIAQDLVSGIKGLFGNAVAEIKDLNQEGKDEMSASRREYQKDIDTKAKLEKEAADARKKRNQANAADAAKLAKEQIAAEKERQKLLIDSLKEGEAKEIAIEELRYKELKKQLDKYHIDTTQATEQHQLNLVEISLKYANEKLAAELELIEMRKAQNEYEESLIAESIAREKKKADGVQAVRESELNLLEAYFDNFIKAMESNGASKEAIEKQQLEFDNQIKGERLKNQIAFQESLLALIDTGDTAAIEAAKNNIAALNAQLEGLAIPAPAESKGKQKSLLQQLGFDDEQISQLQDAADSVISIIQDVTDAQIEASQRKIEAAQKETESAQSFYDKQKQLNEDGFSNDLDIAGRRLEAAKAAEEKALEQKKKNQRQQILLESALQAANLASAAAKTFNAFPGPLTPIAVGIVALMIASFVASKAKALQATKFRDGGQGRVDGTGLIVGNSHEGGGVQFEAEGGEFMGTDGKRFGIVNKRMTSKHFDLLQAINTDNRAKMRQALEGLTAPMDRAGVMGAAGGSVAIIGGGKDKETISLLKDWRNDGKNKKETVVAGKYMITTTGNHTKRVRIK